MYCHSLISVVVCVHVDNLDTTDMVSVYLWPAGHRSSNQVLPIVHGGVESDEVNICQYRMHSCKLLASSILVSCSGD